MNNLVKYLLFLNETFIWQATDIYKRLLLENRDDLALNVYVAMCYYKLDYYDVSLEILAVYLQSHPESPIGLPAYLKLLILISSY